MSSENHNGWVNRETWAASLHLNNDQRLQQSARSCENPDALRGWIECCVQDVLLAGEPPAEWVRLMIYDVGSFWRVDWDAVYASVQPEDVVEIGVGIE